MDITDNLINKVWEKGLIANGYPKEFIRKDACGAWIVKDQYGKEDNDFGWEIDHIFPKSKLKDLTSEAKIDDIINLRPLNIANNRSKGNDYPSYQATMKADGEYNITSIEEKIVRPDLQNKLSNFFGI